MPENVPVGTLIGFIRSPNDSILFEPPFLIVPVPGGEVVSKSSIKNQSISKSSSSNLFDANSASKSVDTDLNIDQSTGEIRTAIELDYEQRLFYSFIAISVSGVSVNVRIVSFFFFCLFDAFRWSDLVDKHTRRIQSNSEIQPIRC